MSFVFSISTSKRSTRFSNGSINSIPIFGSPSSLNKTSNYHSSMCVIRENNQHNSTLYRKPTHIDLYLLWESNQCRRYKLCLMKTLMVRILRICSTPQHVQDETERLRRTLKANGHPPHIIKRGIREGEVIIACNYATTTTNSSYSTQEEDILHIGL